MHKNENRKRIVTKFKGDNELSNNLLTLKFAPQKMTANKVRINGVKEDFFIIRLYQSVSAD